jgi:RNA polymerase sigma factor (sigma-70 family)
MRDDQSVVALVVRAKAGDQQAWDELVTRFAPLVWSICRRHGLADTDANDVGQTVWLRLVEHLPALREPAALPGWLATTTRRECIRALRGAGEREQLRPGEDRGVAADEESTAVDRWLVVEERAIALRAAFARLPPRCQDLLSLLTSDPPVSYAEISAKLEMPPGSIGPNRARCLDRLRRCPEIVALIEGETGRDDSGRRT